MSFLCMEPYGSLQEFNAVSFRAIQWKRYEILVRNHVAPTMEFQVALNPVIFRIPKYFFRKYFSFLISKL